MLFVPLCVKNIAPYRGLPTLHYPRALCVRRDGRPPPPVGAPHPPGSRPTVITPAHYPGGAMLARGGSPPRPTAITPTDHTRDIRTRPLPARRRAASPVAARHPRTCRPPQNRPRWLTAARYRAASPVAARHPGRHAIRADYSCGISNSSKRERTRVPFSMAFVWRKWRMGVYFSPTVFARCA